MSQADKLKEEIGWLKVVIALSTAIFTSLVSWLAQNYERKPSGLLFAGWFFTEVFAFIIGATLIRVYRCLNRLGAL